MVPSTCNQTHECGVEKFKLEYRRRSPNPFHNPYPTPNPGLGRHPKLKSPNVNAIPLNPKNPIKIRDLQNHYPPVSNGGLLRIVL